MTTTINTTAPQLQAWAYGKGDGTYFYGVVEMRTQDGKKLLGKRICKIMRLTPGEALQDAIKLKRIL